MRLKNIEDVEKFLKVVDSCESDVYLCSIYGDKYNIKSKLSQYIAIAELLGEHGDELELFPTLKADEAKFLEFFKENPEIR